MTVISSRLMRGQRKGEFGLKFANTYSLSWIVKNNDPNASQIEIYLEGQAAAPDPTPARYSVFSFNGDIDPSSYCQSVSVQDHKDNRGVWRVDATWKPLPPGQIPEFGDYSDPLQRPAIFWVEFETSDEPVEKAWNVTAFNGRTANTYGPVENSARQAFETPLREPIAWPVLCFQKNLSSVTEIANLNRTYFNKTNDDAWFDAPAGTALFRSISTGPPQSESGVTYYATVTRVAIRDAGWNREVVNRGFGYLSGSSLVTTDNDGQPFAEPILLANATGGRLGIGTIGETIVWRTKGQADFDLLTAVLSGFSSGFDEGFG